MKFLSDFLTVRRAAPLLLAFSVVAVAMSVMVYTWMNRPMHAPPAKPIQGEEVADKGKVSGPAPPDAAQALTQSGSDEESIRPSAVQVNRIPPVPFHESTSGKVLVKAFALLAQGSQEGGRWRAPATLWDVMERELPSRDLPPGLDGFQTAVLRRGPFTVMGRPLAGPVLGEPRVERGRTVDSRVVYLLLKQGETWWQIKVRADFLTLGDGRTLISQATLAVMESNRLDPGILPQYTKAHGV